MAELTDGTKIGRALTKLAMLDDLEAKLLKETPVTIATRFTKQREELLGELEPHVRKAVEAARSVVAS